MHPTQIPQHIAIIMDGNNRYAKTNRLPFGMGHLRGKEALDPIVEHCAKLGVRVLTVFAFSSENWARPKMEVDLLMDLLGQSIAQQRSRMDKHRIRLRFIGERTHLSDQLQQLMADAELATAHYERMTLVIAISYGGMWDITNAAKQLAKAYQQHSANEIDAISSEDFGRFLSLADYPSVDMLVRTGGDYRISNFLLWQLAYAELFFSETLWPDFDTDELDAMIVQFGKRQRRFGKTQEQIDQEQIDRHNRH